MSGDIVSRRGFLVAGAGFTGLTVGASAVEIVTGVGATSESDPTQMGATESLLTDHGVLKRILLIYREYIRRLTADQDSDPAALFHAAQIVHDYIEGFHEGIEEGFVFPRLLAAGKQTSTVRELLTQHDRGRKLTIKIIQASTTMKMASGVPSPGFASVTGRKDLSRVLSQFVAMYEPHEAREDTEVFPGFRSIVSAKEFEDISRQVRKIENSRYGSDALARFVGAIAEIEVSVGINDISLFTPTDN